MTKSEQLFEKMNTGTMRQTWWNDKNIPIVQIDNRYFCLAGWNGEAWFDCWETSDGFDVQSEGFTIKPIYYHDEINDEFDIIDYDLI